MYYKRVKVRPADIAFSQYIRERDNWTCQYCGQKRLDESESKRFHCAHIFTRRIESIRHYEDNAMCLCAKCHKRFTERTTKNGKPIMPDWETWCEQKLGKTRWKILLVRKFTPIKRYKKELKDRWSVKYYKNLTEKLIQDKKNETFKKNRVDNIEA